MYLGLRAGTDSALFWEQVQSPIVGAHKSTLLRERYGTLFQERVQYLVLGPSSRRATLDASPSDACSILGGHLGCHREAAGLL